MQIQFCSHLETANATVSYTKMFLKAYQYPNQAIFLIFVFNGIHMNYQGNTYIVISKEKFSVLVKFKLASVNGKRVTLICYI